MYFLYEVNILIRTMGLIRGNYIHFKFFVTKYNLYVYLDMSFCGHKSLKEKKKPYPPHCKIDADANMRK